MFLIKLAKKQQQKSSGKQCDTKLIFQAHNVHRYDCDDDDDVEQRRN